MPSAPPPVSHAPGADGLWLALSGGGLRAMIYHYGCLKRLHQLGLLQRVAVVSATSGGAVAAALLVASGAVGPRATETGWTAFETRLLETARTGLLGPTALAVAANILYAFTTLSGAIDLISLRLSWQTPTLLGATVLVHGAAVLRLRSLRTEPDVARRLVEKDERFVATEAATAPEHRALTLWKDIRAARSPDAIRRFVLTHQLYHHLPLGSLILHARLYLVAADLSSGREMVFSQACLTDLSYPGCRALWRQDGDPGGRGNVPAFDVPISTAVAASSAYPPFFAPVQVTVGGKHAGSFIDGGVIDNQALNVACQIARHVNAERAHNFPAGLPSDQISHLLAIDAGAAPVALNKPFTSRFGAVITRLPQVLSSRQTRKAMDDLHDVERLTGIPTGAIGFRAGLPPSSAFMNTAIGDLAARVRTHFDRFSNLEVAVIASLGYGWADVWVGQHFPDRVAAAAPPAASAAAVMPEGYALPAMTDDLVVAHLAWSAHRFAPYRAYKRWRGRRRSVSRPARS